MADAEKPITNAEAEAINPSAPNVEPLTLTAEQDAASVPDPKPPAYTTDPEPTEPVPAAAVATELPAEKLDETAKTVEEKPSEKPAAQALAADAASPLKSFAAKLPALLKTTEHSEIWGIELSGKDETDVKTSIVLQKFLNANTGDLEKATEQLQKALEWRRKFQPLKLLEESFDKTKFDALGYVTVYDVEGAKEVVTWNIYGAVKDIGATFGNVEEFVKWRSALMELSIQKLGIADATEPIPTNGEDPYKMVQVHDYLNVSFLRADPKIKAASKEVIETFSTAYPELLKEKFFVNVPVVMGWFFSAMKLFLSKETVKKFHPLSYGSSLAGELGPKLGEKLPPPYGGKGNELKKDGLSVKLTA